MSLENSARDSSNPVGVEQMITLSNHCSILLTTFRPGIYCFVAFLPLFALMQKVEQKDQAHSKRTFTQIVAAAANGHWDFEKIDGL